jgi:thymidylate synthase (FAD)
MGDDMTVADAARVSFNKTSENYTKEQNERLIKYLASHKHISPFGHCFASFRVKAPIFVARQLAKHRFLRINEVSRRYVSDTPEFYVPSKFRNAPVGNIKQGSSSEHYDSSYWVNVYRTACLASVREYEALVQDGVAPEMARAILPQGIMTEWYWSGSLDAFAQMAALRLKDDSQYESRLVAQQISASMSKAFPVSWTALLENL